MAPYTRPGFVISRIASRTLPQDGLSGTKIKKLITMISIKIMKSIARLMLILIHWQNRLASSTLMDSHKSKVLPIFTFKKKHKIGSKVASCKNPKSTCDNHITILSWHNFHEIKSYFRFLCSFLTTPTSCRSVCTFFC